MLAFIANFLFDRKFRCMIGSNISKIYSQENGVPQGAVLSVTLFIIVINDIFKSIKAPLKALLYADDLVIYKSGRNPNSTIKIIQKGINSLIEWSNNVGLQFSQEKTIAINFSRKYKRPRNLKLQLYDQDIPFKKSAKYLGVILDEKLNFKEHINYIKNKSSLKLNVLKTLSHTRYGSDQELLLKVLNSTVLSLLDYAAVIYNSCSDHELKKLDSVLNTGLRLSLGAFKSSPTQSLQIESGFHSLKKRRQVQIMKYSLKILSMSNHPLKESLLNLNKINKFSYKPLKLQPFYTRAHIELHKINEQFPINFNNIWQLSSQKQPPWISKDIQIDISLSDHLKNNTNANQYKKLYQQKIQTKFKNFELLFTDGSVKDNLASYAVIANTETHSSRIPNYSSIFTAEMLGILEAIKIIKTKANHKFVIISDSLSSLTRLTRMYDFNPLINKIKNALDECKSKDIYLLWVPSHVNIEGNEEADKIAKTGLTFYTIDENNNFLIHSDYTRQIKTFIYKNWEEEWERTQNNKLRSILIKPTKKFKNMGLNRKDRQTITRLRIGHTNLTHKYLMEKTSPPICSCDSNINLSVKHLFECINFSQQIVKYKINNINCLKDLENIDKVIKFLKETKLYEQI